ncbi:MAG: cysteine hydrolase [Sphingomonas adhaesiva]|uniref:isochorismatase family cysteine hydrolase n=1 Tax=Sphingomonas adhaesiva TaxID=28212 RepID=UPI002FFC91BD
MTDAAILMIDVLNTFDFDGGEALADAADGIVAPITALREQAVAADVPVIYVNDNYGRWRDEPSQLIEELSSERNRGASIARALRPGTGDYFVIKPESSGFYATTLPALLPRLGVSRLVLVGLAADICVLFTAADAHMREYDLWVPSDAVAAQEPARCRWASELISNGMNAETAAVGDLSLADWRAHEPRVAPGGARMIRST